MHAVGTTQKSYKLLVCRKGYRPRRAFLSHVRWVGIYRRPMAILHKRLYRYCGVLFFSTGSQFPIFYLQLDSVLHKNSEMFSFYSVRDLFPLRTFGTDSKCSASYL